MWLEYLVIKTAVQTLWLWFGSQYVLVKLLSGDKILHYSIISNKYVLFVEGIDCNRDK